jgi:GNAT superfamily N-acetyltransferase
MTDGNATTQLDDKLEVVHESPSDSTPCDVARVTIETYVEGLAADDLYDMYCASFVPLHSRTALGHLLTRHKFDEVLQAPTVEKIIALDHKDRAVGLATLTTDLSTDILSEVFYAERFPEQYARGDLYYLGFLLVRPDARRGGVFAELVKSVVSHVGDQGGVVAFDVCRFNDETFKFAQVCALLARRIRPSSTETLDVQSFYAVTFPPVS